MVLNLKHLYDIVGEEIPFDYVIPSDLIGSPSGRRFPDGAKVKGRAYNRAGVVFLDTDTAFVLETECDRCLKTFTKEFSFASQRILVRSLNEEDSDDYIVTEDDVLDLDDAVISEILLQIPAKMLCSDDCRGLCPHCGADLNLGSCGCGGEEQ